MSNTPNQKKDAAGKQKPAQGRDRRTGRAKDASSFSPYAKPNPERMGGPDGRKRLGERTGQSGRFSSPVQKPDHPRFKGPFPRRFDVLVLGAGASGLMFAAKAVSEGLSVCMLDRAKEPGRKLSISGGGRANFSNRQLFADKYRCPDRSFVEGVLERFGTQSAVRLVQRLGLPFEERPDGRLFLRCEAKELTQGLLGLCRRGVFLLRTATRFCPDGLSFSSEGVQLACQGDEVFKAKLLVLALGSPAFPAVEASGLGYAMAESFGHTTAAPEAALTPLLFKEGLPLQGLQGISLPVRISTCGFSCADDLLFTHDGISGPAALKASLFWERGAPVEINFLPGTDVEELFLDQNAGKGTARSILSRHMPKALADALLDADIKDRRVAELSKAKRQELARKVSSFSFVPDACAGLKRAEVCRGGTNVDEIDAATFQSKKEPRAFIVGETMDVTGLLGGYNLHWAFASGFLAAKAAAALLKDEGRG